MVTERVDVVVTERGSRVVTRNLASIGTAAKGADASVRLLNRALGLIATYASGRELLRMVDAYNNLQNRLRLVTTGTANLAAVTSELFAIANRTRSTYEGTAELYARLAIASKELGTSQQELLTFTERVNQAIILSGASAQEANAGLIQLSQGMASGTLRGDELRSVLEQLPKVADVIAQHLGVTRGQLRDLGAQGKITARDILDAFKDAEDLAIDFAKTVPTIGQAFTVLRNNVMQGIGEFDKASGASTKFAEAVISIANNLDTVVKWVTSLSAGLAVLVGPSILGKAIGLFKTLWTLVRRNPLIFLVSSLASLATSFLLFNDQLDSTMGELQKSITLVDRVAAAWEGAKAYIQKAWENFPEWLANMFINAINGAIKLLGQFINWVGDSVGDLLGIDNGKLDISSMLIDQPDKFKQAGDEAAAAYAKAFTDSLRATVGARAGEGGGGVGTVPGVPTNPGGGGVDKDAVRAMRRLQRELRQLQDAVDPVAAAWREWGDAQTTIESALDKGLITLEEYNNLMGQTYRYYEDLLDPVQAMLDDLARQQELLGMEAQARERLTQLYSLEDDLKRKLTETEREQLDVALALTQQKQVEADLYDEIVGPITSYSQKLAALDTLLNEGRITQAAYNQKLIDIQASFLELDRTIDGGIRRGLLSLQDQFTDLASVTEQAVTNAFSSMEDALVQFVSTGKLDFKSLADSIIQDINRIIIRSQITGPLANWLNGGSGGGGGAFGFLSKLFGGGGGGGLIQDSISQAASGIDVGALMGFKDGGKFTVDGAGGVDSQLVAFRATPGEEVEISKPGSENGYGGGNVYMTVNAQDANSFRKSQGQLLNEMSVGLARARRRNG